MQLVIPSSSERGLRRVARKVCVRGWPKKVQLLFGSYRLQIWLAEANIDVCGLTSVE